jgi:hypothetical protein
VQSPVSSSWHSVLHALCADEDKRIVTDARYSPLRIPRMDTCGQQHAGITDMQLCDAQQSYQHFPVKPSDAHPHDLPTLSFSSCFCRNSRKDL